MAEREGIYISQLPESTSLTDNMLFATDNGADNNSVSAANLAEYVNKKIDVAGQVNNGVSEANSYTDTKKTEAVNEAVTEANSYSDTKKNEAVQVSMALAAATFSNPNLLINGDFQVWQRGESFNNVSANTYFADRWVFAPEGGAIANISKGPNGEAIINVTTGGTSSSVRYYMTDEQVKRLAGKKYTLTIDAEVDTDLTVFVGAFNAISISGNQGNKKTLYANTRQKLSWNFEINYNSGTTGHIQAMRFNTVGWTGTLKIYGIKLELGEVATPFIPRPYGEELTLCQRYYQKLNRGGSPYYTVGSDVGRGNTTCYVQKALSIIMRSIPTVTVNGSWGAKTGSSYVVVNSIASDGSTSIDILSLKCTLASTISNGSIFVLQGKNDKTANIELDAEIY